MRIEGDEVDLAGHPFNQLHDAAGIVEAVVHILQHHILERDAVAVAERELAQRLHEHRKRILAVDGHQPVAHLVGGGVEAHRKLGIGLLSEPFDLGHQARGGDGDLAVAESEAFAVDEDLRRRDNIVGVMERLAHAHEDDVGDVALRLEHAAGLGNLVHNLRGAQMAAKAHLRRQTELTVHRAAHLAADAERDAVLRRDEHRLDDCARVELPGDLAGAIGGAEDRIHRNGIHPRELHQLFAEPLREVGHLLKRRDEPDVEPLPDLRDAEGPLSQFFDKPALELGLGQPLEEQPALPVSGQLVCGSKNGRRVHA